MAAERRKLTVHAGRAENIPTVANILLSLLSLSVCRWIQPLIRKDPFPLLGVVEVCWC